MLEGTLLDSDYTWKVSRYGGQVTITVAREGRVTHFLPRELEEYGDDPLPHRFLLPDGASDEAVATTITAMREAVIATSKKWHRRHPWPDVPKPSLPEGLAPFGVYWGEIAAVQSPGVATRLEASGVVRRISMPVTPPRHPGPYVLEVDFTHHTEETVRFLRLYGDYAGDQARAQLCAWMGWGEQWEEWLAEQNRRVKRVPGAPSVFDVDW